MEFDLWHSFPKDVYSVVYNQDLDDFNETIDEEDRRINHCVRYVCNRVNSR